MNEIGGPTRDKSYRIEALEGRRGSTATIHTQENEEALRRLRKVAQGIEIGDDPLGRSVTVHVQSRHMVLSLEFYMEDDFGHGPEWYVDVRGKDGFVLPGGDKLMLLSEDDQGALGFRHYHVFDDGEKPDAFVRNRYVRKHFTITRIEKKYRHNHLQKRGVKYRRYGRVDETETAKLHAVHPGARRWKHVAQARLTSQALQSSTGLTTDLANRIAGTAHDMSLTPQKTRGKDKRKRRA